LFDRVISKKNLLVQIIFTTAILAIPPIVFEKLTYYYYATASPTFGTFSVDRFWFDIIWFCIAGAVVTIIVGRNTKAVILPPFFGSLIFTITAYVAPLCTIKECYISSTDGLAPLRDFLLFASLAVITSSASMKTWSNEKRSSFDRSFQLGVTTLVAFALSFFPVMHLFAGVSAPYPVNYLQWFLAGAPAGLAGSMLLLDRGTMSGVASKLFAGLAGVSLAIGLGVEIPCEDCSGYPTSIVSIFLLAAAFCAPAIVLEVKRRRALLPPNRVARKVTGIVTTATIAVAIILLLSLFFSGNYQLSVVNGFAGAYNSTFSPFEVGHTFVYSAGYLAIPRVVSQSVGINVSLGNTTISQNEYPNDFLAAGVGDQSPNCCKDGLDLAYRADVIEFSNGTEAVLARAWWACDYVMACGGYNWQQLLHLGSLDLPAGALSNWVELQMNWTDSQDIQWFYRIHYESNGSITPWILYSNFIPPKIQNHYWDAGLLGAGNPPIGYALFYQFGVSSAYPITNGNWQVFVECPNIILNRTRSCISAASYINGSHSFWKSLYTFGETYIGMTFSYLGNYEVKFYYSERSPADETVIWQ